MSETAEIIKRLDRIERMLMKEKRPVKKVWVKAAIIAKATGWNNEGMRRARINGYVTFKKENGSFLYDLESINSIFIKPQS